VKNQIIQMNEQTVCEIRSPKAVGVRSQRNVANQTGSVAK
jgi:hypothetical protein